MSSQSGSLQDDRLSSFLDLADTPTRDWSLSIVAEPLPVSLPRVLGLVGTLGIIATTTRSQLVDEETLKIELSFSTIRPSTADRLLRKIMQLPEVVKVAVEQALEQIAESGTRLKGVESCRPDS